MTFFDWLFRKRPHLEITELPITVLNRWFLYDSGIGEENLLASSIGLTNVSEEGDSKEREDSDARVEKVAYLIPFLDHMSTLTAEVVAESQKKMMLADGLSRPQVEEEIELVKNVYKGISLCSLMASFSIANELGFIHTDENLMNGDSNYEL